jgi:hypothetical protein
VPVVKWAYTARVCPHLRALTRDISHAEALRFGAGSEGLASVATKIRKARKKAKESENETKEGHVKKGRSMKPKMEEKILRKGRV